MLLSEVLDKMHQMQNVRLVNANGFVIIVKSRRVNNSVLNYRNWIVKNIKATTEGIIEIKIDMDL